MVKVKICGITNLADAEKAVSLGADALGFVFAESPRKIDPAKAKPIIESLKGKVLSVGVFVNQAADEVKRVAAYCGLDAAQFHGDEDPGYCSQFNDMKFIKAFRMKDESILAAIPDYKGAFAYLLDAFSKEAYGGTGKVFDWGLAVKAKSFGKPIIISGGLGPDNLKEAIKLVTPYGVDISSSIESSPGKKDHSRMEAVFGLIKGLDA